MYKCKVNKKNVCQNEGSGHTAAFITTKDYNCAKNTNQTEIKFYDDIQKNKLTLSKIIPKYYGTCQDSKPRIIIENLKNNIKNPRDLDIKLGKYTVYKEDLLNSGLSIIQTYIKLFKMRLIDEFSSSPCLNFRIIGGNFIDKSSAYISDHKDLLKNFLKFDEKNILQKQILIELKKIIKILNENKNLVLIGTSLLFVYDIDKPLKITIKLIDFAHSKILPIGKTHQTHKDVILGLENLYKTFSSIKI